MDSPVTEFNWNPAGPSYQGDSGESLVSVILHAGLAAVRRLKAAAAARLAHVVAVTKQFGYHPRQINKNKRKRVHAGPVAWQSWSDTTQWALHGVPARWHNNRRQRRRI